MGTETKDINKRNLKLLHWANARHWRGKYSKGGGAGDKNAPMKSIISKRFSSAYRQQQADEREQDEQTKAQNESRGAKRSEDYSRFEDNSIRDEAGNVTQGSAGITDRVSNSRAKGPKTSEVKSSSVATDKGVATTQTSFEVALKKKRKKQSQVDGMIDNKLNEDEELG